MSSWREFAGRAADYGQALFGSFPACLMAMAAGAAGRYWAGGPELWRVLGTIAPGLFALDLCTGIIRSVKVDRRRICSEALGRSLVKAYVYVSLFLLCVALDWSVRTGYSAQLALLVFIVAREGKSNLENLSALRSVSGVEIPGFIERGFEKLSQQEKSDEKDRS